MRNKKSWSIIVMLFVILSCFAQKGHTDKINLYDPDGKKNGFWIEDWGSGWKRELYYKNGVKHGNCKIYNDKGRLLWFGNYENDESVGVWYHFKISGHLASITKDFLKKELTLVRRDNSFGDKTTFENQCYYISYHPNGTIESEGLLLWHEDPYEDTSYKYGEWKYYNDKGELLDIKAYK